MNTRYLFAVGLMLPMVNYYLCVHLILFSFSSLTLLTGHKEGHSPCKTSHYSNPKMTFAEQSQIVLSMERIKAYLH